MSSLGSPNPFFIAGKKAYEVERSLRFNDNDSTYLTRTPSSDGNRKTFTISFWVKRANITAGHIFQQRANSNDSRQFGVQFLSGDTLRVLAQDGGSTVLNLETTQVFRDPSAWYHIVVAIDSTQSTQSDRQKVYLNGNQITDFATNTQTSQDRQFSVNHASKRILLGNQRPNSSSTLSNYFDGYLAEYHLVDGLQLTPTSFGATDSLTGQWNPKKYVGSYGTNGFYLNFSDNSGTTATTLGKDYSGNGNNFTPNNFAVSDAVKDSPTNNFATLNAVDFNGGSLAEGNLKQDNSGATNTSGTFGMQSGKWYWEIYFNSSSGGVFGVGIGESRKGSALNDLTRHYGYSTNGQFYTTVNGSSTAAGYGATLSAGDILSVKFNADTREIDFLKNNSSQGYTVTVADGFLYLAGFHANNSDITVNFGQDSTFAGATSSGGNTDGNGQGDFKYSVPSGYKALCSANLPDPTILLPNKHFDTTTYTGNETARSFSLNFGADWIWLKERSAGGSHRLFDSVRGANNLLISSQTTEEIVRNNEVPSFSTTGFNIGTATTVNENSVTNVAWTWNAGDTDGKTYTVTVVSDSGNKYRFDGFGTSAVTLDLAEGGTYIFNYPSAHPFRFSTTSDGTHGGGSEYTTGVIVNSSTQVQITVAASAPQLFYYCTIHSGMGGAINTNSTLGSSNFDGTIQNTVKANTTAGFSIVTWTGNGSSGSTLGHGLGVAPKAIITKQRNSSGSWATFHNALGTGSEVYLDLSQQVTNSNFWVSSPTSSVFTVSASDYVNENTSTYVAYCFSEVAGYSKFGRYDGNNNADGTFVYTGFSVSWLMIKRYETSRDWIIYDNKRSTFNVIDDFLEPNNNTAEQTSSSRNVDFLSNGFKFRGSDGDMNGAGDYIYFAFAESPFKNARAR